MTDETGSVRGKRDGWDIHYYYLLQTGFKFSPITTHNNISGHSQLRWMGYIALAIYIVKIEKKIMFIYGFITTCCLTFLSSAKSAFRQWTNIKKEMKAAIPAIIMRAPHSQLKEMLSEVEWIPITPALWHFIHKVKEGEPWCSLVAHTALNSYTLRSTITIPMNFSHFLFPAFSWMHVGQASRRTPGNLLRIYINKVLKWIPASPSQPFRPAPNAQCISIDTWDPYSEQGNSYIVTTLSAHVLY